jgi:hypothetical protein
MDFTYYELEEAINKMKEKKKGGVDNLEPAMIKNLPEEAKKDLLEIVNKCWQRKVTPGSWKKAIIIPIAKPGKDPALITSHRPVSLTPVLAKVMERIVNDRLGYWLEKNGIINKWQAGFQRGRSTEDQVLRLSQDIQDGWEVKPH